MKGALVLRPEPGATRTAARLAALGVSVKRQPLFAIAAVAWTPPDPARFDALLLTSGNAVRTAGPGLGLLSALPVLAVGNATAAAAAAAGLRVAMTGDRDAATLVEAARGRGYARLLHLAGRDRIVLPGVEALTVYASEARPISPGVALDWADRVALLHSARAAARLAELVARDAAPRARIALAALSSAVAAAAGSGWAAVIVAERPSDPALVACAAALIDRLGRDVDKRG